ncbi:hypothetical protein FPV16_23865 [Methylobacterium sp. W2]|uniref:phage tail assembly chaperone n=1 Tax=Methylobacterium sp. W2 TaxID=2598107 RepID=UPI001D0C47C1|nr:hypothetical protein [Methylobacterium sp. W2]MCC0809196.1 hypothetical protein [Methylobacterium sp. W2]
MEREGRELPEGYLDRPLIDTGLQFFWHAFWELTTDRHLGFGAEGRIPSAAIHQFAQRHSIVEPDDFAWFLGVIRAMDSEYLGLRAPRELTNQTPMTDLAGIRGLLRRHAKKVEE